MLLYIAATCYIIHIWYDLLIYTIVDRHRVYCDDYENYFITLEIILISLCVCTGLKEGSVQRSVLPTMHIPGTEFRPSSLVAKTFAFPLSYLAMLYEHFCLWCLTLHNLLWQLTRVTAL